MIIFSFLIHDWVIYVKFMCINFLIHDVVVYVKFYSWTWLKIFWNMCLDVRKLWIFIPSCFKADSAVAVGRHQIRYFSIQQVRGGSGLNQALVQPQRRGSLWRQERCRVMYWSMLIPCITLSQRLPWERPAMHWAFTCLL